MRLFSLLFLLIPGLASANGGSGNVSSVFCFGGQGSAGQLSQMCVPESLIGISSTSGGYFALSVGLNTTANYYAALSRNGVLYQVPNAKYTWCPVAIVVSQTANSLMQLVSATSTFVASGVVSLTGGVYQGGAASQYLMNSGPTAGSLVALPVLYTFGQNTWPGVQFNNAGGTFGSVLLICKETANAP